MVIGHRGIVVRLPYSPQIWRNNSITHGVYFKGRGFDEYGLTGSCTAWINPGLNLGMLDRESITRAWSPNYCGFSITKNGFVLKASAFAIVVTSVCAFSLHHFYCIVEHYKRPRGLRPFERPCVPATSSLDIRRLSICRLLQHEPQRIWSSLC